MATVIVAPSGIADLDRLIATHDLPASTRDRVRLVLATLTEFPRLGPKMTGPWASFRFILGPWPWMLLVYAHDEATDEVYVVTIQDARSASSAKSEA